MKNLIPLTFAAALAASGTSQAQSFSKPSGYETLKLSPGFNFVGLRLVESPVATGSFTSNTSSTLVDDKTSFSLDPNALYLVEFKGDGPIAGLILEANGSSFSGNSLSGLAGITADYRSKYTIRESKTIGSIFGNGNDVILKKGTASTGDAVYLPNANGGFDTYFHSADLVVGGNTFPGSWQQVGSSGDKSATPVNYLDGFYVQVRGQAKDLVVTGQVKTDSTLLPTPKGFSYFSSVYPVGATLLNSELAKSIKKGTSATGDLVLLPDGSGGFKTFFHSADLVVGGNTFPGSWQQVGSPGDKGSQALTSGFILQRRGDPANIEITPPDYYSNL